MRTIKQIHGLIDFCTEYKEKWENRIVMHKEELANARCHGSDHDHKFEDVNEHEECCTVCGLVVIDGIY